MKKKTRTIEAEIQNRRARFDYTLHEEYLVGIALTGQEVRAARNGRVNLKGSYVTVKDNELWLTNASFSVLQSQPDGHSTVVDTGPRKLLAKKREISQIVEAKNQGLTVVPLSLSTRTNFIKLKIATAKGKRLYDKRQALKKRDFEREQKQLKRH